MDDINNLSPDEQKSVVVYDTVRHELLEKKDFSEIANRLVAEGFSEKDAKAEVANIAEQLRQRMVLRNVLILAFGVLSAGLGIVLHIFRRNAQLAFDASLFETLLLGAGVVLMVWGVAGLAKSNRWGQREGQ